jgi:prepilin-type N-terminal cleavage/methylation domain-containing protein
MTPSTLQGPPSPRRHGPAVACGFAHSPRAHRRPRTRRAFTLVEVLATLALIGIVIPVALRGVTLSLNAASHAKHQAEAATLAETKLSEVVAQGDWSFGNSSGEFGPDWPAYRWACETTNPDPNVNVTEVTVTVTWTERGSERAATIATFVYAGTGTGASGTAGGLP